MPAFATPADTEIHGVYAAQPIYPFQDRVTADGSSGYLAEPGRYHLYIAWACPWAHRAAIVRKLNGLDDVISLSYVDDERDARGWAFRERRGEDPVNGFTLLRQAYDATEPGYPGHISVPVLWDRKTHRVVSNNYPDITLDLNTAFRQWSDPSVDLYPEDRRSEIDALNEEILHDVNRGDGRFEPYDKRLADSRYLFGDALTESDVRLWVTLVRTPVERLEPYPHLLAYTRALHELPAFRETTPA
ncbi:glutathione S-transferase C-terminal domain-containing protein [Nonomuraea sp. NPDC050556]|uniref:glutathione S-transferase C-terminal domain-containing protein n=1 Tax=Nonomuraea sp. NPDC050556 TaxID=3364369 RepID=UPI0037A99C1F